MKNHQMGGEKSTGPTPSSHVSPRPLKLLVMVMGQGPRPGMVPNQVTAGLLLMIPSGNLTHPQLTAVQLSSLGAPARWDPSAAERLGRT